MPLRITIELIPRGDESRKRKLAQVDIENDGTAGDMHGGGAVGNYKVVASADMKGGYDEFASFTTGPLKRGDYVDTAAEILGMLHSSKLPHNGFITGHVKPDPVFHPDPCPFCGAESEVDHDDLEKSIGLKATVQCTNLACRAFGPDGKDEAEAVEKWNKRLTPKRQLLCGWIGMAGGEGCIRPLGHEGAHGFRDGSGCQSEIDP